MNKYNPYLKMKYNVRKNTLKMTPETLIMWLDTWAVLSPEQRTNIKEVIDYFIRERKENEQ